MLRLELNADQLAAALLGLASVEPVCLLDSCGVGYLGSHLMIAGIEPMSVREFAAGETALVLACLDEVERGDEAAVFTLSYDLGRELLNIPSRHSTADEPGLFIATFRNLILHDYPTGSSVITGDPTNFERLAKRLLSAPPLSAEAHVPETKVRPNVTRTAYMGQIEAIKEQIREGNTYQTNLTHQMTAAIATPPELIFARLRRAHPAAFAAFLQRLSSTVVSASPERFVHIYLNGRVISTSPVKGTRPRGHSPGEDARLRTELLNSEKDRAENIMIVDLLRNDIGRVCKYGSVEVERLCDLEEHPTYFHLVSTINGRLRAGISFSETIRAVFPCGSITGAPKISTMRIIDELETVPRGLSMGAVGYFVPGERFGLPRQIDMSVAIRTMVVRDGNATFNVGGGITIDSDPEQEYEESLTKARALLQAINGRLA